MCLANVKITEINALFQHVAYVVLCCCCAEQCTIQINRGENYSNLPRLRNSLTRLLPRISCITTALLACIVYSIAVSSQWQGERWLVRTCCSLTKVGILAALWVQHSGVHHSGPQFTHFGILALPSDIDLAFQDSALWPHIQHSGVRHSGLHSGHAKTCRDDRTEFLTLTVMGQVCCMRKGIAKTHDWRHRQPVNPGAVDPSILARCVPACFSMTAPPLTFYRTDAPPTAQSTASKHWRHSPIYKDIQITTGFCKYYIGSIGSIVSIGRKYYIGGVSLMSAAVTTPSTRQKTMLEAKKSLNFDAEVSVSLNTAPAAPTAPAAVGRVLVATFRFLAHMNLTF